MLQYKERLFYPSAAGIELAAVVLFLAPDIIPLKRELNEAARANSREPVFLKSGAYPLTDNCCERLEIIRGFWSSYHNNA